MFEFDELERSETRPSTAPEYGLGCGDLVRVMGLTGATHLNGQTGQLVRHDSSSSRWDVRLPSGEIKAIKIANLERKDVKACRAILRPGLNVRIAGLTGAAHLNDMEARLERFDSSAGRWEVMLPNGMVKAIKTDNLELAAADAEDIDRPFPAPKDELRIASWNLLAPCYHRTGAVSSEVRTEYWRSRLETQLLVVLNAACPDMLCLQEVWFSPTALGILEQVAGQQGYQMATMRRVDGKQDGVAVLVRTSRLEIVSSEEQVLCSIGQRVALWLFVKPRWTGETIMLGTTHFTFPHDEHDNQLRLKQATAAEVECRALAKKHRLDPQSTPLILAGDLNCEPGAAQGGDAALDVFLRQGWRSAFAEACGQEAGVTHQTHNDEGTCADFVLVRGRVASAAAALLPHDVSSHGPGLPRPEVGGAARLSVANPPATLHDWSQLSDHRPLLVSLRLGEGPALGRGVPDWKAAPWTGG